MNLLPIISWLPGSGRTFLAANLAPLLAAQCKGPVLLVETGRAMGSAGDLALYFNAAPAPRVEAPLRLAGPANAEVFLAALPGLDRPGLTALDAAARKHAWVILDGLLPVQGWDILLETAGRGLLVERGDLVGASRMGQLLAELESAGFPRNGLAAIWNQPDSSQPLPDLRGMPALRLPAYAKATERLAQGVPASLAEPSSPLARALAEIAKAVPALPEMPRRQSGEPQPVAKPHAGVAGAIPVPSSTPARTALLRKVLAKLLDDPEIKRLDHREWARPGFIQGWTPKVSAMASALLAMENEAWLDRGERAAMTQDLVSHILGYGPLEGALADPAVTEIMVNGKHQVYLERQGRLALSNIRFWDDAQLLGVIERIVAPVGRRIDESSPRVDARLPDGSRVNAIIPPLSLKGPCLTIRKFPSRRLQMEDLVASASLSGQAADFLRQAVLLKKNVVVSGGTGSGKTTLLNVLSGFIPDDERIVTIEDAAELQLQQEHVVSLEARPANLEGRGAVTIRDLVANSLRMRPDRIVVGECRGGEALDMLQAMNTGHEGSLTTVHANSPRDALSRLETLCLMAGLELPLKVVRSQIAGAVDLVVQAARLRDGSRRVTAISEITGMEGDIICLQDLFAFKQSGFNADGKILGEFTPTGVIPDFYRIAREAGLELDLSIFSPKKKSP